MARLFPDNNFVAPLIVPGNRLVVAEAPGELESELGEPLVGPSGSLLRGWDNGTGRRSGGLYAAAGVDQSTVSRMNCIQCRPPKNLFPTDPDARSYITAQEGEQSVQHCFNSHVKPVLSSHPWNRVDILGDKALRVLTGKEGGILRWRGSPLAVPATGSESLIAVPTLHPAYLARTQELKPAVVCDLKKSTLQTPENYSTHPSLEEVRAFTATEFAFDIETIRATNKITMVGLCDKVGHSICVPAIGEQYVNELKRIFRNATSVIGHNCVQFDWPRLREFGISPPAEASVWDTMLMQHLLQPDLPHSLAFVGSIFTNKPAWKHLSGDDEELYCCRDVDVTYQCWRQLKPLLRSERLLDLYERVSRPLAEICHLLTETGFRIDASRLTEVRADLLAKSRTLELELPEQLRTHNVPVNRRVLAPNGTLSVKTGKPVKYLLEASTEEVVPWASSAVLIKFFYEEKRLPAQTHAKTDQPTIDKTAIPKLLRAANVAKYVKEFGEDNSREVQKTLRAVQSLRQIASLLSTFTKEEFLGIDRIHASFNVHGTASGRLSSSDPNLQNIPESARYIYVPSHDGWRILDVDFSSLENRLTAWFAQDYDRLERLSNAAFNEHKWTTSQFFDIPYEEVVKDNSKDAPYGKAKRIGHGSNYGMGPLKIARLFDLPLDEVRLLCEKWRQVNAKTVAWQTETAARAKKDGFLVTPFGRKRWFYTDSAYTESLSFLPQSTGADIVFRCMIALMHERIGWDRSKVEPLVQIIRTLPRPSRMLVQVHDSLVVEAPPEGIDETLEVMQVVMSQPWPELGGFSIPAEPKVGLSWGEVKSYPA